MNTHLLPKCSWVFCWHPGPGNAPQSHPTWTSEGGGCSRCPPAPLSLRPEELEAGFLTRSTGPLNSLTLYSLDIPLPRPKNRAVLKCPFLLGPMPLTTTFPCVLPPKPVYKLADIPSQGSGCFPQRFSAFTIVFTVRTMAQY